MKEKTFKKQLDILIDKVKNVDKNKDNEPSYSYLMGKLSVLSIENINDRKDAILYFLADSYNGDKQIATSVSEFISSYSNR